MYVSNPVVTLICSHIAVRYPRLIKKASLFTLYICCIALHLVVGDSVIAQERCLHNCNVSGKHHIVGCFDWHL